MLEVGQSAPEFCLEAANGEKVSLSDFKGKKVVLYFYPKDNTPGCTAEACGFRDKKDEFDAGGTVVLGISRDSLKSHQRFIEKHNLNFTLLSDPDTTTCQAYGAWGEKTMCGRTSIGLIRSTFVIDEKGMITQIYRKVRVKGHVEEVLSRF